MSSDLMGNGEALIESEELSWGAFTGMGHGGVIYTVIIHSRFIIPLDRRKDR